MIKEFEFKSFARMVLSPKKLIHQQKILILQEILFQQHRKYACFHHLFHFLPSAFRTHTAFWCYTRRQLELDEKFQKPTQKNTKREKKKA